MTITEAKIDFSQKLANAINESKLNPTMMRLILADMDRTLAQLEKLQFQAQFEEKGENNDA